MSDLTKLTGLQLADAYFRFSTQEPRDHAALDEIVLEFRRRDEREAAQRKALEKIANAGRFINGMVIDPCAQHMCYAKDTADIALAALEGK